jgi:AraC family transcriptional regulator of adaptative response/methylated-DNA-[protein]-cysteine methyltransferase
VVAREVARVIDEPLLRFERPLDARGTPFQRLVWDELSRMGPGETVTYAGLAQRIGRIGAARAVAAACAANPLAVVIPCHRVVGSNGSLTGYRWGIDRKRTLLERERDAVTTTR